MHTHIRVTNPKKKMCCWHEPTVLANKLCQEWGIEGFIWLDSDGSQHGRWIIMGVDPVSQVCCHGLPDSSFDPNPFKELRNLGDGHWTGWLSYEAAAWIEPKNPWKTNKMSTLWLGKHDPILKFDLKTKQLWLEGYNSKRFNELFKFINQIKHNNETKQKLSSNIMANKSLGIRLEDWEWLTNNKKYINDINQIQNWIQAGDIFQANLTTCCEATLPEGISLIDIFNKLRHKCPAPFSGLVVGAKRAKGEAIISASPERFIKVSAKGKVETRPIKGTRPRGINASQDARLAAELICSIKDRAENIMIVDLLRNDLGKVCKPGSITVDQITGLESFSEVHHLTSVIEGSLQEGKTWVDLLESCWPGGSISGAPKLRACQRLHELEPTARGPYCGSLLRRDWDGSLDSNLIIRSLIVNQTTLRAHAGCGIVADSKPSTEAEELQWKLLPILKALQ